MSSDNIVPSIIQNGSTKKTIAFPFQKGNYGLPALASPTGVIYSKIVALLNTSKGERVMNYSYGMELYRYNFTNMTVVDKMRLATSVTNGIERFISGVKVKSVTAGKTEYQAGVGTVCLFDILWSEAGSDVAGQFPYEVPGTGVE